MSLLRIVLPLLYVTLVAATYGGHRGGYAEYDCGGTCGGGCGYGNPCGNSAPIVEPSGCATGECGGSSRSSGHRSSSSSGYHKSVTTVVKETRNDEIKILVGKPTVHRTTYVEPQPVIRRTTYIEQPAPAPVVYHKKQRYVEDGGDYASSGCAGPCGGGGSRIVKIIKKTTYADGGSCSTCGSDGYSAGYTGGEVEYSQPVVKVTRIVTQPKVVVQRVVKTVEAPSSEYYEDSGSSYQGHRGGGGHHGGRHKSYGGGGGGAKAFAFASASASAGAFGGSGSGSDDYTSGGGGGGCKSGCDQWKK